MSINPQESFFHTGKVALNVARWPADVGNTKAPILFLHGITDKHQSWHEVADGIRHGALAIAPDHRGHGHSGRTPGQYLFTDYPHDAIALLEAEQHGPFNVIGHSLGAIIAMQVAALRPDLVSSLVMEDPPFYFQHIVADEPQRGDYFKRNAAISGSGLSREGMADLIRKNAPDLSEERVQASSYALFVTDAAVIEYAVERLTDTSTKWIEQAEDMMRSVRCPTLLLQGALTPTQGGPASVMRPADGERIAELIENCHLIYWDNWGHLLHKNDPARFIQQVNDFTGSVSSTG